MSNCTVEFPNKLISYIGFAVKARKTVKGIDNIRRLKKQPPVILYDGVVQADTRKRIDKFREQGTACFELENLEQYTCLKNVKVLAVTDQSLALAIVNNIKEER